MRSGSVDVLDGESTVQRKKRKPDYSGDKIFSPSDPLPTARAFRRARCSHPDAMTIHHDGGDFYRWNGTRYEVLADPSVRAELYPWLETAEKMVRRGKEMAAVPFAPNTSSVNNVIDALKAESHLPKVPPCWLSGDADLPDPLEIIPAANGLIHLTAFGHADQKLVRPPTPLFFSLNSLDYAFDPYAPEPIEWLQFLDTLWADDPQAIECLQDWFGYCLTPDTRQEKALLVVGPKRAGKGTIARTLTRLVGAANVCGPTLSSLATNFGLSPLVGKLLAIISDARLSGKTDQAIVVERILALTGEDSLTVDRKHRDPVTLRLPTRLMLLTNELPKLSDSSGALASRFIVLTLTQSFYDREDTELESRLATELPGILNWAIEGWHRLRERGRLTQPATSKQAISELNDLSSPISAFVREWCVVNDGKEIDVDRLFNGWRAWCKEQGREQITTKQVFGRDLRAAVPGIDVEQRRKQGDNDERYRVYVGIDLNPAAQAATAFSHPF